MSNSMKSKSIRAKQSWLKADDGQAINSSAEEHRHPSWSELIFDLVIVASLSALGECLKKNLSAEDPWTAFSAPIVYVLLFKPIFNHWQSVDGYINRYGAEGVAGTVITYAHTISIGLMNIAILFISEAETIEERANAISAYAGCNVLANSLNTLTFLRVFYYSEQQGWPLQMSMFFGIEALLWLAVACSTGYVFVAGTFWALILLYTNFNFKVYRFLRWLVAERFGMDVESVPLHVDLCAERYGLLVIIAIGECFMATVAATPVEEDIKDTSWILPTNSLPTHADSNDNWAAGNGEQGGGVRYLKSVHGITRVLLSHSGERNKLIIRVLIAAAHAFVLKAAFFDVLDCVGERSTKHAIRSLNTAVNWIFNFVWAIIGITLSSHILEEDNDPNVVISLPKRMLFGLSMALVLVSFWHLSCQHERGEESSLPIVPIQARTIILVVFAVGFVCLTTFIPWKSQSLMEGCVVAMSMGGLSLEYFLRFVYIRASYSSSASSSASHSDSHSHSHSHTHSQSQSIAHSQPSHDRK